MFRIILIFIIFQTEKIRFSIVTDKVALLVTANEVISKTHPLWRPYQAETILIFDSCPASLSSAYNFFQIPSYDRHLCCSAVYFLVILVYSELSPVRAKPLKLQYEISWIYHCCYLNYCSHLTASFL